MRPPQAPAAAPLVLIVDDNRDTRELYEMALREAGFRTAVAENGREAVEKAMALRPRVVLLDYSMPILDGIGVARRLRRDVRTKESRVIVVSALAQPPGIEPRVPWLVKPVLPDEVVARVRDLVMTRRPVTGVTHARLGSRTGT
jgi:CheY-like chemotaxis protein